MCIILPRAAKILILNHLSACLVEIITKTRPKVFVVFVLMWQQNSLNRNVIIAYYVNCAINGDTFHVQVLQRSNLIIKTFPGLAHSAHQLTSPLILGRTGVAKYYNIITENVINENV